MIPDAIVDEVRARADIVEMIGEHVALKRAGKDFKARCPFHQEKTPSFNVVPSKGMYHCFGCGESGDVFTFLMKHQGLAFPDAVRQVAVRVGIEVPESGRDRREDEEHRTLFEAVAFAADFFRRRLDDAAGERARNYLELRGIDRAAANRYQIGYAPDGWRALRDAAHHHGIDDEVLLESGLIKRSERAEEPYDRLRDRIVFPITDGGGRVIAFGGRVLGHGGDHAPKYLNSPETPIYHKGRILYGLHWARTAIRREEAALVVEGYMDYVALAARGIENVVAPLGTAMTAEQAGLLARYTGRALLLYDSDAAGMRATFRTADALLRAGVHPLVVSLPGGEDPDSVVRAGGAGALRPRLDAAVDVLERKLQILESRGYFEDSDRRRKALDGLLPTLRAAADPALRDIYVARVAERTGVRRSTLEQEVASGQGAIRGEHPQRAARPRRGTEIGSGPGMPDVVAARRARGTPSTAAHAGERKLLMLLVRDPERVTLAAEALDPAAFADPVHRELFEALAAGAGAAPLGSAAAERLEQLRVDPEDLSQSDRIFAELVADIRAQALFHRLDVLKRRVSVARADEEAALLRERAELKRELQALGSEFGRLGFKLSARYRRYRQQDTPASREPSTAEG